MENKEININEKIKNYQNKLFIEFSNKYKILLSKISEINSNYIKNNTNITDLLSKFNNDFKVTTDSIDDVITFLDYYKNKENDNNDIIDPVINKKIKDFNTMNNTIEQFLPLLLLNNIYSNL